MTKNKKNMENLGLDFKLILAQIINFTLVFLIIKKFIATPFLKFIKKEKKVQEEKEKIELLVQQKKEELEKEEIKLREKWRKEAQTVINQAKKDGEKKKTEIIEQAKKEAGEQKKRAKKQMEEERTKMEKEIKKKIVDLGVDIVEKALSDYLKQEAQKEATHYIIKKFAHKTK